MKLNTTLGVLFIEGLLNLLLKLLKFSLKESSYYNELFVNKTGIVECNLIKLVLNNKKDIFCLINL